MDSQVFKCSNCGAPLDYDGSGVPTMRCPYCGTSVTVPKELRTAPRKKTAKSSTPAAENRGCLLAVGAVAIIGILLIALVMTQLGHPETPSPLVAARDTPRQVSSPTKAPTQAPTLGLANPGLTFGSKGTGVGMFNSATNIAVDGENNVYVGERQGGRVHVFDASGKFINQWFVGDSKTILYGLAADRKGIVYTARDGMIERHDGASGKLVDTLQYAGGNEFESIALAPDGGLVAMWYKEHPGTLDSREGVEDNLVRFDAMGQVTQVITSVVSNQTDGPERELRLAVDGTGNLFLASRYSFAVFKFSREGKFINRFGSRHTPPAPDQFDLGTMAIGIDNQGRVLVMNNDRVLMFSADGRHLDTVDTKSGSAYAMALGMNNEIWLAEGDHVSQLVMNER